jgi:myo-inositol catabolism protein IolC
VIDQFRTLLHSRPFDPADLNADDQQALLDLFQAAREAQEDSRGGRGVQAPLTA